MATKNVGIFVFDDVEVLDLAGPYEVFTTASRMRLRDRPHDAPPYNVFAVAATPGSVRARAGLVITPDVTFSNHAAIDVLVVPGGVVTEQLKMPDVTRWIEQVSTQSEITASVCTGAFLLGQAGLLADKWVTTHWEDIEEFRAAFPASRVRANCRWVDEGHIVTSAGISAGIDMSLHLVERTSDRALAERTAHQMDFTWTRNA